MDIDDLAGKEVTYATALNDLKTGWLKQVVLRVEDLYLVVAVDADTDEILLSMPPDLDVKALERQFSSTRISNQRKRISYIWRLTNQYGYADGLQLEFDDTERTNVQLLAEGGQLVLSVFRRY